METRHENFRTRSEGDSRYKRSRQEILGTLALAFVTGIVGYRAFEGILSPGRFGGVGDFSGQGARCEAEPDNQPGSKEAEVQMPASADLQLF